MQRHNRTLRNTRNGYIEMGIVSILEVCVMNTLHSTMYDTYTILPTATASNNDEQQKQQHMEKEIQIKLK